MPEGPKKDESKTFSLRHVRDQNFKVYYSNGVQIAPTPWDVQFMFEQIIIPPAGTEDNEVVALQSFAVIMSIEHAKRFLYFFQKQMQMAEASSAIEEPAAEK